MANLKVYEWERTKWPEFQRIALSRWQQEQVLAHLSRQFNVTQPHLCQSYQSGAKNGKSGKYLGYTIHKDYFGEEVEGYFIAVGTKCMLGVLVHEFAHHLNRRHNPSEARVRHHGKTFKKWLRSSYSKARKFKKLWA